MGVAIRSFGHFIPEGRLTNAGLHERFGLKESWILERTGIEERRYFPDGPTSDMIVMAAQQCLEHSGLSPQDIDCIIVATMTPDQHCPSTAAIVHNKLGTKNAFGFDIMAACSGYLYALQLGTSLINSGSYKNILVCGGDKMSSCIDPDDRKTVLLLADAAGVSLLSHSENSNDVIDTLCLLDSSGLADITMEAGGSAIPLTEAAVGSGKHFLHFESKNIFATVLSLMQKAAEEILSRNQMTLDEIDFIVPHQANKRLIESLAVKLGLPIEKFIINVEHIGNTSAASIPVAISQSLQNKKLKGNERLLLVTVGAGYTYGASLINMDIT